MLIVLLINYEAPLLTDCTLIKCGIYSAYALFFILCYGLLSHRLYILSRPPMVACMTLLRTELVGAGKNLFLKVDCASVTNFRS